MSAVVNRPRNSCKALVFNENKVLTIRRRFESVVFYILPGGGQLIEETFHDALMRECEEEIGIAPKEIMDLVLIREFIGKNHEFPGRKATHQIEYMFLCKIDKDKIKNGNNVDEWQEGIEWIELDQLKEKNFFPKGIIEMLKEINNGKYNGNIYLGDMN